MDQEAETVSSTARAKIKEVRRRVSEAVPASSCQGDSAASELSKSFTSTTGVLTGLNQIQKENLRKFYQGKSFWTQED